MVKQAIECYFLKRLLLSRCNSRLASTFCFEIFGEKRFEHNMSHC